MKIAVATQGETKITGHTGKCRSFLVYDTDQTAISDKTRLLLTQDQTFHASSPQQPHLLDDVQVIICGSVGRGLLQRLNDKGIATIVTQELDPDVAVQSYLAGTLVEEDPLTSHHHHDEGDDQASHDCGCSEP